MDTNYFLTPLRTRTLNPRTTKPGHCVVYLMSRDQRVQDNAALITAQQYATEKKRPLIVLFHLFAHLGERCLQQYTFMLHGLQETEKNLQTFAIPLRVTTEDLRETLDKLHAQTPLDALFFDFSPLRQPRQTRTDIATHAPYACFEVDAHNIVPAWVASDKEEYAASTFRPKIHKHLAEYLTPLPKLHKHPFPYPQFITNDWHHIQSQIQARTIAGYQIPFKPGERAAHNILHQFLEKKLIRYATDRNDPTQDATSHLSPYLHFGNISSLRVALAVQAYANKHPENSQIQEGKNAFLEELIVRKELADNYCFYNSTYDVIEGARPWAQKTIEKHTHDPRTYTYTLEQLEQAQTHDPAWNAAQRQMTTTGWMHGYMRMYWAKKILEWTPSIPKALRVAITLNDRYELDGYDPNGYTGIMWSIAGVHDRPWPERPIFGTIRYMNYAGLKRKMNITAYENTWTN